MQRRFRTRWRWLNAAIGAVVVSVVAGVATAPLVSHTFGMIPLVGILLNPIALLPATVIVLCGTVWMLVPFSFLAPFLRGGIEYSVWVLEAVTRGIERMPGACIEYRLDAPTPRDLSVVCGCDARHVVGRTPRTQKCPTAPMMPKKCLYL